MDNQIRELQQYLQTIALPEEQSQHLQFLLNGVEKNERVLKFNVERAVIQKRSISALLNQTSVDLETALNDLQEERRKSEELLLNILPETIAARLKDGERTIADNFADISLLFADIVSFTPLSSRLSAGELVQLLNSIFSEFDQLVERHGLEKIKTIGDSYMVVGGLPNSRKDHTEAIAEMALDIQKIVPQFSSPTGEPLTMRIGIHAGPVTAGVIGRKKFSYDLWGDTVNTASRMESHGIGQKIHTTQIIYERLKNRFLFEPRGNLLIKGKGEMLTYFLIGKRECINQPSPEQNS
jgi:adenylate cyclase